MLRWPSFLPQKALNRLAGAIATSGISRHFIPWFVSHYSVDVIEAEYPALQYPSLQAFFCRRLRPGLRPLATERKVVLAPVDGTVGACGRMAAGCLVQAKGFCYSLTELLGGDGMERHFAEGSYLTFYLAPPDYHRIHAPLAGEVISARYQPGSAWPVNPSAVASRPRLFARNQRLITYLETSEGKAAIVKVGALLVGGVRAAYDQEWRPRSAERKLYSPSIPLDLGAEIGWFEFGSTVILLLERATQLRKAPGCRIRVGEAIADIPHP